MSAELDERYSPTAAVTDRALAELCRLLEQDEPWLAPDAVWLSGQAEVYARLRELEALTLANVIATNVLCHECCDESFRPGTNEGPDAATRPYRGHCPECGWVTLAAEQARMWHAQPAKLARWLAMALRLTQHYPTEGLIDGCLWRLGEIERRRKRHTIFFGRRLDASANAAREKLDALCAPGTEILITTTDVTALRHSALRDRRLVPLRAVAHLRKAGLVVENLDAYLGGPGPVVASDETSLRLMHTRRVALIDGKEYPLSPQVYDFLKVLEDADGDEVHKRYIAETLGIQKSFRKADVFKHHKLVFDAFAESDSKGNYWLKPDFVILDRGRQHAPSYSAD